MFPSDVLVPCVDKVVDFVGVGHFALSAGEDVACVDAESDVFAVMVVYGVE